MKRMMMALVALVLMLGAEAQPITMYPTSAATSKYPVYVDERVEFVEGLAHLVKNSIFAENLAPRYQKELADFFAPYMDHPCFKAWDELRRKYCINYSAVPSLAVNIEWKDGAFQVIPYKERCVEVRWTKEALQMFLPLLSDLYVKSNFHQFFLDHRKDYDAAVKSFNEVVVNLVDMTWFDKFYGDSEEKECRIVIGLCNGPGNFSTTCHPIGQKKQLVTVMCYGTDSLDAPYNIPEEHMIMVHEFCHPYVTPTKSMRKVARKWAERYVREGGANCYNGWANIAEETFVRASCVRYMLDHNYPEAEVREAIRSEHEDYGYTWLPDDPEWYRGDIYRLLKEYKE